MHLTCSLIPISLRAYREARGIRFWALGFTRRLRSELQRALSQRGFQSPAPASLGDAPRLLLSVAAFAHLLALLYANAGICQVAHRASKVNCIT
jgi:hypothetical protein